MRPLFTDAHDLSQLELALHMEDLLSLGHDLADIA